jgi:acetyl esterase
MTLAVPFRVLDLLARAAARLGRLPTREEALTKPLEERHAEMPARWVLRPRPPEVISEDTHAGSVPVRVYRTGSPSGRALLYVHGGGFMFGGVDACDHICADLADLTGDLVVSVDYRLAPDHPFPAGLDDCEEALRWLVAQAGSLGVDASRIAVAGDSAGGNLAAALCLRVRDVPITHQVLIYPMLDLTCSRDSWVTEGRPYLNVEDVRIAVTHYYDDADVKDPFVSPLFAEDLGGLPPALVVVAEHDTLRDDGLDYGVALADAGVTVRAKEYRRMPHGYLQFPRLTDNYDKTLRDINAFLRSTA